MSDVKMRVIHSGQYVPYGDSYKVYELETDMSYDDALAWCKREILSNRYLPSYEEFQKREDEMSPYEYFRGFWNFIEFEGKYRFTITKPYTD